MDTILRRGLVEMEALGIRRVLAHSEKAAAYMADGAARVSRKPGVYVSNRWVLPTWQRGCKMLIWQVLR
jgi:hypothetical protein